MAAPRARIQEAHEVTQAILDLRDKGAISVGTATTQATSVAFAKESRHRPNKLRPLSPRQMNKEEKQASFRIEGGRKSNWDATTGIGELRFFHEIDMEPAETTPSKTIAGVRGPMNLPDGVNISYRPADCRPWTEMTWNSKLRNYRRQVEILMQEKELLHPQYSCKSNKRNHIWKIPRGFKNWSQR
jgi:hypothetical protein